jgi:hypothetical protein
MAGRGDATGSQRGQGVWKAPAGGEANWMPRHNAGPPAFTSWTSDSTASSLVAFGIHGLARTILAYDPGKRIFQESR